MATTTTPCPRDAHTLHGQISVDVSRPGRLHPFSSANITGRSAARERRLKRKSTEPEPDSKRACVPSGYLVDWTDDEGETDSE